jgi:hypothetical protein
MEHYFSLYNITDDLAKLRYGVLHLDQERWQWWQWRKTSRQGYIAWTQFVTELYELFDTDTNHLGRLTKLNQSGTVEDFIAAFERLAFQTEGMTDAFFRECFISGLKEEIRAHVLMAQPTTWVEATKKSKEAQQIVSSQNRKPSFIPHPKPVNPTTPFAPLKIQKLTRAEMDECQLKGLCYNCDEKYFPGHKCKEQNIFMAIVITEISSAHGYKNSASLNSNEVIHGLELIPQHSKRSKTIQSSEKLKSSLRTLGARVHAQNRNVQIAHRRTMHHC